VLPKFYIHLITINMDTNRMGGSAHIGIIKDVIIETNKVICTVDWIATNLDRDIADSKGCFKSIHGPFKKDKWVEKVFCL